MNSSISPDLETSTIENAINPRRSRLLSDWRVSVLVLIGLWVTIYLAGISRPALLDDVDTVHAEAAREMVERHDWVTLYTNGFRYLEKAPLMYWSLAASYQLFGIDNWSMRLPLMLGVLALTLVTYRLGRYVYGNAGGICAGMALVTSLGLFVFTRFLIPEVFVTLWLTLGYYFFMRSLEEEQPSRFVCWGFAAMCALNVLTKGLIGLIFPVGTIALFYFLTGNLRRLLRMHVFSSVLVFLAIAAPWHILAALHNPAQGQARGFLWFYFINEHVMRFLGKRVPPGYETVPLVFFWGLLLVWLLPWSVFLPQALRGISWRNLGRNRGAMLDRRQCANLLFFLWAIVILGFFSFSTRQEYYTIPALPAMALLVGGWLSRESEPTASRSDRRAGKISSTILLVFGVLAFVAGMFFLFVSRAPVPGTDLADLLKKNPNYYDYSLGHLLDLTPSALGAFRGPLIGTSLGLLLGPTLNWILRRYGRPLAGNIALVAMMIVLLASMHSAFVTFSPILSSYDLVEPIRKHFRPGDVIVIDGEYHQASTLNFYTGIQVHVMHEPSGNLWYGAKFPDAPHIFETQRSLAQLWSAPATVFLWSEEESPRVLQGLSYFLLARSGGKFIFTNHEIRTSTPGVAPLATADSRSAPLILIYVLLAIAVAGTVTSTIVLILSGLGAVKFRRYVDRDRKTYEKHSQNLPPVSVLKPVHGNEARLKENVESFFRQDYPEYEILFAADEPDDSAIPVIEEIRARYPQIPSRIMVTGQPPWPQAANYCFYRMAEVAAHHILVTSDSDVEVGPDYLRDVVPPLLDPQVGAVTCVSRGKSAGGIWSALNAIGVSVEATAGVLIANLLEGIKFGLGETIALRKDSLARIGGYAAIREYLSNDFVVGNLIHKAGFQVVLSSQVVYHVSPPMTFRQLWERELRWSMGTRYSRPKGHLGTVLTFAVPYGILGLLSASVLGQPLLGLTLFAAALLNRMAQCWLIGWWAARDADARRATLLYPLRDLFGFIVWCASYPSKRSLWRGNSYELLKGGRLKVRRANDTPINSDSPEPMSVNVAHESFNTDSD